MAVLRALPLTDDRGSAGGGLLGPAEIRALAAHLDLRPTKTLGQNFVHDANTVRRIARAAEAFLLHHPGLAGLDLRFDMMLVAPLRLPRHWRGAWRSDD